MLDICWIAWPLHAPRFSHNKVVKLNKTILYAAGAFFSLAFVGALVGPRVSAAVRAALVEVVMPSNPFFDRLVLSPQNFLMSTGPNTGALGITQHYHHESWGFHAERCLHSQRLCFPGAAAVPQSRGGKPIRDHLRERFVHADDYLPDPTGVWRDTGPYMRRGRGHR